MLNTGLLLILIQRLVGSINCFEISSNPFLSVLQYGQIILVPCYSPQIQLFMPKPNISKLIIIRRGSLLTKICLNFTIFTQLIKFFIFTNPISNSRFKLLKHKLSIWSLQYKGCNRYKSIYFVIVKLVVTVFCLPAVTSLILVSDPCDPSLYISCISL